MLTRLKNSCSPVTDGRFSSASFFQQSFYFRAFPRKSKDGITGDDLFQSCEAVQEVFLFDAEFSVLVNIGSVCWSHKKIGKTLEISEEYDTHNQTAGLL